MTDKPRELKERLRDYALRIMKLSDAVRRKPEGRVIAAQMLRSGTSVGAHHREGIRARSASEYTAKLNTSLMELEETLYWIELIEGRKLVAARRLSALKQESSELAAILVTLIKKAKSNSGD